MNLQILRNFLFFSSKNPTFLYKPHFSFTFSLVFASTSTKRQPKTPLSVSDFLLHKHQFSPETASKVASVLTRSKNPEKYDSLLLFLKDSGLSKIHLEKILKSRPLLLSASLERNIKPKIKIFQDLGFSSNDIAEIISNDPWILVRSADNRLAPSLSLLKGLLGCSEEVAKLLKKCGWFLKLDLEKSMVPNIEIIKSCGVGMDQIIKQMGHFPRFLLCKPENMKKSISIVNEMGPRRSSKLYVYAIRVVSSMSDVKWELKLKHLSNLGFSEDDILHMFRTAPQVFAVSERKMEKVREVLLATGKYDIPCIVNNPIIMLNSVEKKIKPRMQVLGILESRNLIEKWPGLATFIRTPDSKFFEKFVHPFLKEVGEAYMPKGITMVKYCNL